MYQASQLASRSRPRRWRKIGLETPQASNLVARANVEIDKWNDKSRRLARRIQTCVWVMWEVHSPCGRTARAEVTLECGAIEVRFLMHWGFKACLRLPTILVRPIFSNFEITDVYSIAWRALIPEQEGGQL